MQTPSNASNDKTLSVGDVIDTLEVKSKGGGYIYRGERKCYEKVSSSLYRDFNIEEETFVEVVQTEMLNAAKKHVGEIPQDFRADIAAVLNPNRRNSDDSVDFELLTELQHYGAKTNLIDFTTDYLIALFFACDGCLDKDGRVILQKTEPIKGWIRHPQNPRHRVIAQKSVFVRPPYGFFTPDDNDIVTIPKRLKQEILDLLRNYHGISTETIYNDLHGFIRNQDRHGDTYTQFYRGLGCQDRADKAGASDDKRKEYVNAIEHYTSALKSKFDFAEAYNNRGNVYLEQGAWDQAIEDYDEAIRINPDFAEAYSNRGNVYFKKGDWDRAINEYNMAIQLNSDFAEAYNNRSNVYLEQGDWDRAIDEYDEAMRLNPDLAKTHNNQDSTYVTASGKEAHIPGPITITQVSLTLMKE